MRIEKHETAIAKAASTDLSRLNLTGVHITGKDGKVCIEATNGKSMIRFERSDKALKKDVDILLRADGLAKAGKDIRVKDSRPDTHPHVLHLGKIDETSKRVHLRSGQIPALDSSTGVIIKRIEAQYPNTTQVIEKAKGVKKTYSTYVDAFLLADTLLTLAEVQGYRRSDSERPTVKLTMSSSMNHPVLIEGFAREGNGEGVALVMPIKSPERFADKEDKA